MTRFGWLWEVRVDEFAVTWLQRLLMASLSRLLGSLETP